MVMSFIVKECVHFSSLKFLVNNVKRIAHDSIIRHRALFFGYVCDNLRIVCDKWNNCSEFWLANHLAMFGQTNKKLTGSARM